MFGKQRLMVAGVMAFLIFGLGACGAGTDATGNVGQPSRIDTKATRVAEPDTDVFGLRHSVRHLSAKTVRATRPRLVKKCSSATRRIRHSARTGTGKRKTTRTWYTTERYQDCKRVGSGTETYTRVVRAERWCVSLDDVNGDTSKDDVWYQVTGATYSKALGTDENTRMKFTPTGTGC
ncbi:hypothetical protein ACWDA7_09675 [Streptomyces sp. NPDC001156]